MTVLFKMLNSILSKLFLNRCSYPFVSVPIQAQKLLYRIDNSRISHSFSSFIRFGSFRTSLVLKDSSFSYFLSSVVHSSRVELFNQVVNTQRVFEVRDLISVSSCTFALCSSSNHGGAILVEESASRPEMNISESGFTKCSAPHGGAMFVFLSSFYLTKCCFFSCSATSSSHVCYINTNDRHLSKFEQLLIVSCPSESVRVPSCVVAVSSRHDFNQFNSTQNRLSSYASCVTFVQTYSFYLEFFIITNSTGITSIHCDNSPFGRLSHGFIFKNWFYFSPFSASHKNNDKTFITMYRVQFINNKAGNLKNIGFDNSIIALNIAMCELDEGYSKFFLYNYTLTLNNQPDYVVITPLARTMWHSDICAVIPTQIQTNSSSSWLYIMLGGSFVCILVGAFIALKVYQKRNAAFELWLLNQTIES